MIDKHRRAAALKFRRLLDRGVPRKLAILQLLQDLRAKKQPCSRRSLYAWCARFKVSTK